MPPVICNRTDYRPHLIASEERPCSKCGHACWVSPASCEHLDAHPESAVVCLPCAPGLVDGKEPVAGLLPGTVEEIAAFLRDKERN